MWKRLLARLHPDAGGDLETFLLASTLRADAAGRTFTGPGPAEKPESDTFLCGWRSAMDAWATGNRDTLRMRWAQRFGGTPGQ